MIKKFGTNNPTTIKMCENAMRLRSSGGYVIYKGKPITIINMHYSRHLGTLMVVVEYEPAQYQPGEHRRP